MSHINTAFITQWFPPEPAQVPLSICMSLADRGHEVTVVTGIPNYPSGQVLAEYKAWRPADETLYGFRVKRTPLYPDHGSSALKRMLNYVSWALSSTSFGLSAIRNADVALIYSSPATAALAPRLWRRISRTPYVLLIQDLWPDSVTAAGLVRRQGISRIIECALNIFVNWIYRGASEIAVISPGMIKILTLRGVPADKISLIYNWSDWSHETPAVSKADARADLGLPANGFVVTYAGNHGAAQGLEAVIHAASMLEDLPNICFHFVGDGVKKNSLQSLAHELGCTNVVFREQVSRSRMPTIQAASDLQLVSLIDNEIYLSTMPSKMQSILAQGGIVMALASGDVANAVRSSGCGWTVSPGDSNALEAAVRAASTLGQTELDKMSASGRNYYLKTMSEHVNADALDRLLRKAARSR